MLCASRDDRGVQGLLGRPECLEEKRVGESSGLGSQSSLKARWMGCEDGLGCVEFGPACGRSVK